MILKGWDSGEVRETSLGAKSKEATKKLSNQHTYVNTIFLKSQNEYKNQ